MNFKKTIAVFGVLGMILPSISFGATSTSPFGGQNFCNRLSSYISKMETRITDREQNILSRRQDHKDKWSSRLENWDEKREAQRDRAEVRLAEFFLKLEARATTDAQKQALINFQAAIQAAIQARKAAVDAAILAFRTGAEKLLLDRKTSTENAVSAYKTAQKAAFDKAKASCGSGVEVRTVWDTLKADLKLTRDNFQTARQAIEKVADKIKDLNQAKKAAIEKAHQDFKAALEKAKADFRIAFPQPTPSFTPMGSATTTPVLSPTP